MKSEGSLEKSGSRTSHGSSNEIQPHTKVFEIQQSDELITKNIVTAEFSLGERIQMANHSFICVVKEPKPITLNEKTIVMYSYK